MVDGYPTSGEVDMNEDARRFSAQSPEMRALFRAGEDGSVPAELVWRYGLSILEREGIYSLAMVVAFERNSETPDYRQEVLEFDLSLASSLHQSLGHILREIAEMQYPPSTPPS